MTEASKYECTVLLRLEGIVPERARWWNERVQAWASAQEIDEQSKRTYIEHVGRFPEYFEILGYKDVHRATAVTREAILAFKYGGLVIRGPRRGQTLAITTRAVGLGLLRRFLAFEGEQLHQRGGPVLELALNRHLFHFRRGQVRSDAGHRMNSVREIAAVLGAAPSVEARAMLALGLYGGLRPAEARAVLLGDLELAFECPAIVHVRKGKWSKPRIVQLPRHTRSIMLAAAVGKTPSDRIYPFSRSKQARDLSVACQEAGTRHYSPHDLRRTYASMMFEAGAPLEAVQDQLGHEDPRTTRLYQGPVRVARAIAQFETFLGA
jgi:integrase